MRGGPGDASPPPSPQTPLPPPCKGLSAPGPFPQIGPHLKIIPGQAYQALGAAHAAVVASGTATVEAALAGVPTVIVYRVSPLTFALARRLVRVEHVGMANLLAGERVFPELLQDDFTPERLAHEVLSLIQDPGRLMTVPARPGHSGPPPRGTGGLKAGRPGGGGIDIFNQARIK